LTYAHSVVESIADFNVTKAIQNLKVQELLALEAQDKLIEEHAAEYEKFVDAYNGDISKSTTEEFQEWIKDNYKPEDYTASHIRAIAISENMHKDDVCIVPGTATEGDLVLGFITGADAMADNKMDDVLIDAVETGEHRTTGIVISDGGDNMELDIQLAIESKGAQDARELIHTSLEEGCETVQAKAFIFSSLGFADNGQGEIDEILFLHVECSDTSKAVRMRKVIRNEEGRITKFNKVSEDIDPDKIEGYFTNVVKTQSFLN